MKLKLHLAVLALAMLPGAAMAACFDGHAKDDIVMSCADGQVYDAETQSCVPLNTG
ncbi:MAG: carbohydrate-binding module family 14 protein [Silicimonas sp.]|nr:carbohydrate-binding module family 14 protein [Silicimonas sp.]NNF90246.1 adenylosuccinate lyase [Boseongicola sp.]NND19328.1 adenylosuccinate lyase [Silicimonas sp.]NND21214.1 adenylosuccinate lyase [Silicimonas sp.]NND42825.1 adenylosuccinate lyase [Silicimonas sp.]